LHISKKNIYLTNHVSAVAPDYWKDDKIAAIVRIL
jgi:hypothetical protein